jgi:uncharacterized protein (DUF1800 family)
MNAAIARMPNMPMFFRPRFIYSLGLVIALTVSVSTAQAARTPKPLATPAEAAFILNRVGFGPTPDDAAHVETIGVDAYLDEQLHPERLDPPTALTTKLAEFDSLKASPAQLYQSFGPPARKAANGNEDAIKIVDKNQNDVADQSRAARLLQAIYSPAQLQESLIDFWFNHFNVFVGKDQEDKIWTGTYERDAIRPYVFAHFRELLGATAKHPAMLYYLDNWQSKAAVTNKSGKTTGGLNENYAREVMELHTLGVDGGYTQKDVTELARILTGWGFDPKAMSSGEEPEFRFDAKRHDADAKTFLGQDFPAGGGEEEGEHALDMLAASPKTARHIAYELAQYFVADVPPPKLVDQLAKRYLDTGGDLRQVIAALVKSPEFRNPKFAPAKFKTPLQYVVSAVRATGEPGIVNVKPLLGTLNQLGEPLYGCITPDGYKNTEAAWLNPDAMIDRLNFATALGGGYLPLLQSDLPVMVATASPISMVGMSTSGGGAAKPAAPPSKPKPPDADAMVALFGETVSPTTRDAMASAKPQQRASLLLGSPEFMRR